MLIGIDASRANRARKTGTEWYAYHLIRELARLDSRNQYVLYTDKPLTGGLANLKSSDNSSHNDIVYEAGYQKIISPHNNFKAKVLGWPWETFWTLGRLSWEMLAHSPELLFVPAHTLPLFARCRQVVTVHDLGFMRQDLWYDKASVGGVGSIVNAVARLVTRGRFGASKKDYLEWSTAYALKHADKIITISEFSKQEIIDLYPKVDQVKLAVVYNGYNQTLYHPIADKQSVDKILAKHGLERPFIFSVGRLEKKKNTARLIEAFALFKAEYPDFKHKLVLIGDASFGYEEVRQMIDKYDLSEQVILPGWIDELDLPAIYNGADLFIFPSNYEGFGIPLLEAMACGTPIVASKTASLPEIAQKAAVYFDPTDRGDMAEKIADVILSESLRQELVQAGFRRIKEFGWEESARQTLAVLESIK